MRTDTLEAKTSFKALGKVLMEAKKKQIPSTKKKGKKEKEPTI